MGKLRSQEAQEAELRWESRRSDLRSCGSAPVPHCSWRGRGRRGVSSVPTDGFGCTKGLGKGGSSEENTPEHTVPHQCAPTRTNPHTPCVRMSTRKCVFSPCTYAHLSVPTRVPYTLGGSFTRGCMHQGIHRLPPIPTSARVNRRRHACTSTDGRTRVHATRWFVPVLASSPVGGTHGNSCACAFVHTGTHRDKLVAGSNSLLKENLGLY